VLCAAAEEQSNNAILSARVGRRKMVEVAELKEAEAAERGRKRSTARQAGVCSCTGVKRSARSAC
jgi:hypothetical protein